MAEAKVKFHAFRIFHVDGSAPLEEVIAEVSKQKDLEKRLRKLNGRSIRAEEISWDDEYGVWLIDLVWFRETHGPGKGSFTRPVQGHEYDADEYPTEDTAALYDPQSRHLILQYNHQGVRVGSLLEYFARYHAEAANAYGPEILLDSQTGEKFQGRVATKKFELTIAPQELDLDDWRQDPAINDGIRAGQETNARRVKISCSMDRGQGALSQVMDSTLNKLFRLIQRGENQGIEGLRVGVLEHVDATIETLDLIGQRLTFEKTLQLAPDRRIPRKDRWHTLKSAFRLWRDKFA